MLEGSFIIVNIVSRLMSHVKEPGNILNLLQTNQKQGRSKDQSIKTE